MSITVYLVGRRLEDKREASLSFDLGDESNDRRNNIADQFAELEHLINDEMMISAVQVNDKFSYASARR
jgi:hypothetical protein